MWENKRKLCLAALFLKLDEEKLLWTWLGTVNHVANGSFLLGSYFQLESLMLSMRK